MTELLHPSNYVAHRGDMLFIDRVLEGSANHVLSETTIGADHIFFDKGLGGVPAWAGIEFMAQAVAAWVGLEDLRQGREVQLGFLLGSRAYDADAPIFQEGVTLRTYVKVILSAGSTVVFAGEIKNTEGEIYAQGELTAYRPDDVSAYLKGEVQWQRES